MKGVAVASAMELISVATATGGTAPVFQCRHGAWTHRASNGRPRAQRPDVRYSPRLVMWWTCSVDRLDHCVTIGQAEAGAEAENQTYASLCGRRFRPAPMTAPPNGRCRVCHYIYCQLVAEAHPTSWLRRQLGGLVAEWRKRRGPM